MKHHFNLGADKHFPIGRRNRKDLPISSKLSLASLRNCLPIWLLILLLSTSAEHSRKNSILDDWAQLKTFQRIRAASTDYRDQNEEISQLRQNFLSNTKIKDKVLQEEFRTSGLSHLLALSGGQTGPAAMFVCNAILAFIFGMLRVSFPAINANNLIGTTRYVALLIQTSVLTFLVGLYQSTGALSRSLATQVSIGTRSASILLSGHKNPQGAKWIRTIFICSPWILSWMWHQNPSRDLSFVLSVMGGLTANLVDQFVDRILDNPDNEKKVEIASRKYSRLLDMQPLKKLIHWTLATAMTSACMSVMTLSLWPSGNLFDKIFANLLAGPCVLFLITPASLLVCLGVVTQAQWLTLSAQKALGFALFVLREIAESFSSDEFEFPPPQAQTTSFTGWLSTPIQPVLILSAELALLYLCLEVIRERRAEL